MRNAEFGQLGTNMKNSHFEKEKFNFPKDEFNFWQCSSLLPMNPLPFIYFHNKKILFSRVSTVTLSRLIGYSLSFDCIFEQLRLFLHFSSINQWTGCFNNSIFSSPLKSCCCLKFRKVRPRPAARQVKILDKYQTSTRPVHYLISPKLIKKHFFFSLPCADFILFGSF